MKKVKCPKCKKLMEFAGKDNIKECRRCNDCNILSVIYNYPQYKRDDYYPCKICNAVHLPWDGGRQCPECKKARLQWDDPGYLKSGVHCPNCGHRPPGILMR